ncbi:MAG: hypothetical protein ACRDHO_07625 [Actinomycetota bacterium]
MVRAKERAGDTMPCEHHRLQYTYTDAGHGTHEREVSSVDSVIDQGAPTTRPTAIPTIVARIQDQETHCRWWAVANPPAWALGWYVSSYVIARNIDERFPIFGASGAVVFGLLTWLLLAVLLRAAPQIRGTTSR